MVQNRCNLGPLWNNKLKLQYFTTNTLDFVKLETIKHNCIRFLQPHEVVDF